MPSVYFTPDDMCTMLKLEVKRIHDFFVANGWDVVDDPEQADRIVCPTCAGWDQLEENSIETLAKLKPLKEKVIAVGCVNTVNPEGVEASQPGAKVSSLELEQFDRVLPDAKVKIADIPEPSTFRTKEDYRLYDLSKRYVNVAFGCAFQCAYCPHVVGIGRLKSRSVDHITEQVRQLVGEGVRTVVLTGMETGLYGKDIGTDYATLLASVLAEHDQYQIHVAQFHPSGLQRQPEKLLEALSHPRVTDMQIPIQTTSARLLKMMQRPPLTEDIRETLRQIPQRNPSTILRTDLMVGYPTETREELEEALAFAVEVFDEIAVYAFEQKSGMPSSNLADQEIDKEEMQWRVNHAVSYINKHDRLAHGGQQSGMTLEELEAKKQAMRQAKAKLAEARIAQAKIG
ncbi:radical SAM protein [Magnetococcus sp. PR-3]|uniref:radical SAM protein n=1 Tax=Magnetococcus sp. PR-3 TaxID=3120355 RepID=UPI002FCDFEEB